MSRPQPSALRTWVTVLGFLIVVLLVLGGVGYGIKTLAHRNSAAHAGTTAH